METFDPLIAAEMFRGGDLGVLLDYLDERCADPVPLLASLRDACLAPAAEALRLAKRELTKARRVLRMHYANEAYANVQETSVAKMAAKRDHDATRRLLDRAVDSLLAQWHARRGTVRLAIDRGVVADLLASGDATGLAVHFAWAGAGAKAARAAMKDALEEHRGAHRAEMELLEAEWRQTLWAGSHELAARLRPRIQEAYAAFRRTDVARVRTANHVLRALP